MLTIRPDVARFRSRWLNFITCATILDETNGDELFYFSVDQSAASDSDVDAEALVAKGVGVVQHSIDSGEQEVQARIDSRVDLQRMKSFVSCRHS